MTITPNLWHFDDVLAELDQDGGKCHLLLGAGFSAGANAEMAPDHLTKVMMKTASVCRLFERERSRNVEQVMGNIYHRAQEVGQYDTDNQELEALRSALIGAVARSQITGVHSSDGQILGRAGEFLARFDSVFSLNFDQLAYRAFLRAQDDGLCKFTDGFNSSKVPSRTEKVYGGFWSTQRRHLLYPHGALFIRETAGELAWKLTRRSTQFLPARYPKQLSSGGEMDLRWICLLGLDLIKPLIVAAGAASEKLAQIRDSRFLSDAFAALERIEGNLVTYGWSMSDADDHLINAIVDNPNLRNLYVGIYGDPCTKDNQRIIAKTLMLLFRRDPGFKRLDINFYSSDSASVWSEPDAQFIQRRAP